MRPARRTDYDPLARSLPRISFSNFEGVTLPCRKRDHGRSHRLQNEPGDALALSWQIILDSEDFFVGSRAGIRTVVFELQADQALPLLHRQI